MKPLPIDIPPGQPDMPEDTPLFLCLHTLNSAFDRIVTMLAVLNSAGILSAESILAKTASLEALRMTIDSELQEALGQSTFENLHHFSKHLRSMERELIDECMTPLYPPNATQTDA